MKGTIIHSPLLEKKLTVNNTSRTEEPEVMKLINLLDRWLNKVVPIFITLSIPYVIYLFVNMLLFMN
ncbi:hypothetical protein ACERII_01120 [Evansella sp. AB-rgal1]|uniref:hypothetical protein n=1 Tax=Evansella sp. AB-rgal1 TaxID=3242696 RepID=UPI00359E2C4A